VTTLNEDYEKLLREGLLAPPEDFVRGTMARVAAAPEPAPAPVPRAPRAWPAARDVAQWLALAGAALVGAIQVASYVFGIWILSSAG
jgi:hypothetical protein